MDKVRIFALGGLDENGKNMSVIEVNNRIFIIEAGIMFPDSALLGVEYVIPDFRYLIENKERIGGIFITHAHDDVMRALPFLLKQVKIPVYTGKFTSLFVKDLLDKEGIKNYILNVIDRTSKFKIDGVEIRTFAMTHASPDNYGIAIKSSQGFIVYSGEFIIDYNTLQKEYVCDLNELSEIGKEGVLCLLSESVSADIEGHTAPKHKITNKIEPIFEANEGRFIIACYRQSLYRILEILDLALKFKKKIFIRDDEMRKTLNYLEELGYYKLPKNVIIEKKQFKNDMKDVVVLVTGRGRRLFLKLSTIATNEDQYVELKKDDTIIVASPVVSGTEHEAVNMENEIYKEGGKIYSFKAKDVASMHPSSEDLKMALYLFKPKYYMPIKGEYRHLIANANLATMMGFSDNRILLLDNGQVAEFINQKLIHSQEIIELEDTLIDGDSSWDVTGVVLKDREWLSTDGVMIIGVTLDNKTKKIVSGIDVQTRGLIYLKDADYLVKGVMKIMEDTLNKAVKERRYENLECRQEAKDKIQKYLAKETGKRPMVLPVILEISNKV